MHGGRELGLQLLADGLRKRRHQLLLHLLRHLLAQLLLQLRLDLIAHAAHVDGIRDACRKLLLRHGLGKVVVHGALHAVAGGVFRRVVLHLLLVPGEESLHDLGHRLRQLRSVDGGLRAVEVKLHAAEVEVQGRKVERRRVDAYRRRVEGRQAGHVDAGATQVQAAGKIGGGKPRGQLALVDGERLLNGLAVNSEQTGHVEAGALLVLLFGKRLAGDHVRRRVRALVFDDLRFARLVDKVADQGIRVVDTGFQAGDLGTFLRLHHAGNLDRLATVDKPAHKVGIARLVLPHLVLGIVLVELRGVDQLELHPHQLAVVQRQAVFGDRDLFLIGELTHHGVELGTVAQPHGIEHEVAHRAAAGKDDHRFIVVFRPMTSHDVVLVLNLRHVGGKLVEDVGAHHGRHDAVRRRAKAHAGKRLVGVDLVHAV